MKKEWRSSRRPARGSHPATGAVPVFSGDLDNNDLVSFTTFSLDYGVRRFMLSRSLTAAQSAAPRGRFHDDGRSHRHRARGQGRLVTGVAGCRQRPSRPAGFLAYLKGLLHIGRQQICSTWAALPRRTPSGRGRQPRQHKNQRTSTTADQSLWVDSRLQCSHFVLISNRKNTAVFMTLHDTEVSRSRTLTVTAFQSRAKVHAFARSL
jgi:hypothetical protein